MFVGLNTLYVADLLQFPQLRLEPGVQFLNLFEPNTTILWELWEENDSKCVNLMYVKFVHQLHVFM